MTDRVRVSKGMTQNLGNYNSARWDFAVDLEPKEGESLQSAKERAEAMVEKWNAEEQEKWDK